MAATAGERRARLVAAGLAVMLILAGCSATSGTDPNARTTEGSTVTAGTVRVDREPLTKRFPKLGDFVEAHWLGSLAGGSGDSRVPGPSDVLIQAFVVLRPEELAALRSGYEWTAAPAGWDEKVDEQLRAFRPAGGDWRQNSTYGAQVRTAGYNGTVLLDLVNGIVFLDVNSS